MVNWSDIIISLIGGAVALIGYVIVDRREKSKQLDKFKKEILDELGKHREEYLNGIQDVKDDITDLRATYQQSQAVICLQISSLEKKQDKHNSVIERTYKLEQEVEVLKNRESVSEHRIEDLENEEKRLNR